MIDYEKMSKGKRVLYTLAAILMLAIIMAGVWYYNTLIRLKNGEEWCIRFLYDEKTADIVNTLIFLLLATVISLMCKTMSSIRLRFGETVMNIALVSGALIGFNQNIRESMFVHSGAYFYLFSTLVFFLFVWVYMREIPYDCFGSKEPLFAVGLWIIPLALLAGFGMYNMGPAAFVFAVITINYVKKVDHVIQPWMIEGIVFSAAGYVARVLFPMYETKNISSVLQQYGSWTGILGNINGLIITLFDSLMPAIIILVATVILAKGVHNISLGTEVTFILWIALVSFVMMIAVPRGEGSESIGIIALIVLVCNVLCRRINDKKPLMRIYIFGLSMIIWLNAVYRLACVCGLFSKA